MKYFLILFAIISIVSLNAQEWTLSTDISFTISQSAYSDNWAGEELGAISWVFDSHSQANKQLSELFFWKNNLRFAFGQTHQQQVHDDGDRSWGKPKKTTDRINLESLLRMDLKQYVDPFFSFRWESQLLDQSDKDDTIIFNPMRFTESAGVTREIISRDNHRLSSRLGGAFRQNFNRHSPNDSKITYDGGVELVSEYRKRLISQGININSKLILYQAIYSSEADEVDSEDWKALDVTWENNITTKIWSIINLVLNFDLIYEKEEDNKPQFRQNLGLGVAWQI